MHTANTESVLLAEKVGSTTPLENPCARRNFDKVSYHAREPVLTRKVLSSDDRHDVDVLGQQSLSVGGHRLPVFDSPFKNASSTTIDANCHELYAGGMWQ
ncbi:hypothetical protein Tco_1235417 [Tanacetum coccineum]